MYSGTQNRGRDLADVTSSPSTHTVISFVVWVQWIESPRQCSMCFLSERSQSYIIVDLRFILKKRPLFTNGTVTMRKFSALPNEKYFVCEIPKDNIRGFAMKNTLDEVSVLFPDHKNTLCPPPPEKIGSGQNGSSGQTRGAANFYFDIHR